MQQATVAPPTQCIWLFAVHWPRDEKYLDFGTAWKLNLHCTHSHWCLLIEYFCSTIPIHYICILSHEMPIRFVFSFVRTEKKTWTSLLSETKYGRARVCHIIVIILSLVWLIVIRPFNQNQFLCLASKSRYYQN